MSGFRDCQLGFAKELLAASKFVPLSSLLMDSTDVASLVAGIKGLELFRRMRYTRVQCDTDSQYAICLIDPQQIWIIVLPQDDVTSARTVRLYL